MNASELLEKIVPSKIKDQWLKQAEAENTKRARQLIATRQHLILEQAKRLPGLREATVDKRTAADQAKLVSDAKEHEARLALAEETAAKGRMKEEGFGRSEIAGTVWADTATATKLQATRPQLQI